MQNYKLHGRIRLGRTLKKLLDEAETGLSRPNSWGIIIIIIVVVVVCVFRDSVPVIYYGLRLNVFHSTLKPVLPINVKVQT